MVTARGPAGWPGRAGPHTPPDQASLGDARPCDRPGRAAPAQEPSGSYRILAVCLGNICRSPTAEAVLRAELTVAGLTSAVEVESAGTGDWHLGMGMDQGARAELTERGYDGSRHRARQLNGSWLGRFDLILAMDRYNLARPARDGGRRGNRGLPDPAAAHVRPGHGRGRHGGRKRRPVRGRGARPVPRHAGGLRAVFDLIRAACIGLAAQLARLLGERPRSPMG